jgi:hypothetical protein
MIFLKRELAETTRRFETAADIEENALLGADVREPERFVEITDDEHLGARQSRSMS